MYALELMAPHVRADQAESLERDPSCHEGGEPFSYGGVEQRLLTVEEVPVAYGLAEECRHTALYRHKPVVTPPRVLIHTVEVCRAQRGHVLFFT